MGRIFKVQGRKGWYVEFWDSAARRTVRERVQGTQRDAKRLLLDLQHKAQRQALGLETTATNDVEIEELIAAWHADNQGRTRAATWSTYALGVRVVLEWLEKRRTPAPRLVRDLRLDDVKAYQAEALGRGLSARSVGIYVGSLRYLLAWAAREGRIASNPLAAWKPPKGELRRRRQPLTAHDLQRLFAASPPELADVWRVLTATLLRSGELLALEFDDVDTEGQRLRIRAETSKSGRERWVPFGATVASILTRLRLQRAQRPDTEAARRLVFVSPRGCPWRKNLLRRLKPCLAKAGLMTRIDLHSLRHTGASHLIAAGADVKTVQEMLGHASAKMTLDVYAHAFEARRRDAAAGPLEALVQKLDAGTALRARANAAGG